jgi:glycosyltransferase involved in cell wall biosynthesis
MVEDVPAFLSAIDAYVSSSLSEGLPLALVEAAVAAVPMVATRAGGTPEIVDDGTTGLLVEPGDAHALAEACVQMLEHREQALAMGKAARMRALAEFTPEVMVSRTLEVYRQAMPALA